VSSTGMNTYPLIETELGPTEQHFIDFVEQHARAHDLPREAFHFWISTWIDDDTYQARHSVEVIGAAGRVWRIEHSLKRTEGRQARSVELETRFALTGPGVPDGYGRRTDVEATIDQALDAMRAVARAARSERAGSRAGSRRFARRDAAADAQCRPRPGVHLAQDCALPAPG
jgi:hypothetical protein